MLILIIAIVAVIGILWLQFKCFNSTKDGIEELNNFFPSIDKVSLKECTTNKDAIYIASGSTKSAIKKRRCRYDR